MLDIKTATDYLSGHVMKVGKDIVSVTWRPQDVNDYITGFRQHLNALNRPEQPQDAVLQAGVDCLRWYRNCPCGGGIALHPDWQFAGCLSCGRSWNQVEFPTAAFLAELEKVFACRPGKMLNFSWWPEEETLNDLLIENRKYGWALPEGMVIK